MAQYIYKSALVAEIMSRIDSIEVSQKAGLIKKRDAYTKIILFKNILSLIDTLEVKEVDLEKESFTWKDIGTINQLLWDLSDEYSGKSDNEGYYKAVLSRFKAQKGEEV